MAFFKEEHFRGEKRLPSNFITGFLEVRQFFGEFPESCCAYTTLGTQLICCTISLYQYVHKSSKEMFLEATTMRFLSVQRRPLITCPVPHISTLYIT